MEPRRVGSVARRLSEQTRPSSLLLVLDLEVLPGSDPDVLRLNQRVTLRMLGWMRKTLILTTISPRCSKGFDASGRRPSKRLVNDVLRRGLAELSALPTERPKFRTREVSLVGCLIGNINNINETLGRLAEPEGTPRG
jgi:hypothetical protein